MNTTATATHQSNAQGPPRPLAGHAATIARRACRDLLYLTIGLVTSIVAFVVWVAGLSVTLSLALFIVGIPAVIATAFVFRWVAELDRRNAALVLDTPLGASYRPREGGLLERVSTSVRDPQTWRDLAWLVLHSVTGFVFGVVAVSLVATVLGLAVMPLWYWAIPGGATVFGEWWAIDTLWEALLATLLALPVGAITVPLVRLLAVAEARMARALLGAPGVTNSTEGHAGRLELGRRLSVGLPVHAAAAGLAGVVSTSVWALTGGEFWPAWVLLGLATTVALHWLAIHIATATNARHALRVAAELAGIVLAVSLAVWGLAGGGYLWPAWVALGLAVLLALVALVVFRGRLPGMRERQLEERVDVLTRTRRGALDVQAAELRRIERDLHDGAQARLVALSMQLGRAEERLSDQPEIAALLEDARGEANAAIGELRDLARGIAPPVLADRGLEAAVEALGRRVSRTVAVDAQVEPRPPAVIETAAYFVVAESLTNVAKHAPGASARVRIVGDAALLRIEISDDGPGGADADGGGLTGLRHRVEALDGTLSVSSPRGGGTTIRAELPCES